jgi:nitrous oxidase accessory protein NosD
MSIPIRSGVAAAVGVAAATSFTLVVPVPAAVADPSVVYVAPSAQGGDDTSCAQASESSIQDAVDAVAEGGTVIVCAGTYAERVDITRTLTLRGMPGATIDADGEPYGVGIGADYVTVRGFTVENAFGDEESSPGDGILTASFANFQAGNYAEIVDNITRNNDGSGIDLNSTHGSSARGNTATGNGVGINVSNDLGLPAFDNTISHNDSSANGFCGIALADHTATGVYDNHVSDNTADDNGGHGGAGILMATPAPGGSIHGNVIAHNAAAGNGHAGVMVHVHVPNATFYGNQVVANTLGTNNLNGDEHDPSTTAIYVGSNTPLTIHVAGNRISDNDVGIFTAGPVTLHATGNHFKEVGTPMDSSPTYE